MDFRETLQKIGRAVIQWIIIVHPKTLAIVFFQRGLQLGMWCCYVKDGLASPPSPPPSPPSPPSPSPSPPPSPQTPSGQPASWSGHRTRLLILPTYNNAPPSARRKWPSLWKIDVIDNEEAAVEWKLELMHRIMSDSGFRPNKRWQLLQRNDLFCLRPPSPSNPFFKTTLFSFRKLRSSSLSSA